jgi:protein CpxP
MTSIKTLNTKLLSRVALGAVTAMLFTAGPIAFAQEGGGWHGGGHGMHMRGQMDPARAAEHMERMISHRVPDATADQKARLSAIAKAAMADLKPIGVKIRAARAESARLLTQQSIDRAAIERVRADISALNDARSKRMTQAFADAAEVLTPAQRAKIAERMQQRQARMQQKRPS